MREEVAEKLRVPDPSLPEALLGPLGPVHQVGDHVVNVLRHWHSIVLVKDLDVGRRGRLTLIVKLQVQGFSNSPRFPFIAIVKAAPSKDSIPAKSIPPPSPASNCTLLLYDQLSSTFYSSLFSETLNFQLLTLAPWPPQLWQLLLPSLPP